MSTFVFIPLFIESDENTIGILGVMVPIILSLGLFLLIFGLDYLKRRERMTLIERGIELKDGPPKDRTFQVLRISLLFIGIGTGLLLSFFLTQKTDIDGPGIYFPMLFIFGGLGLLSSYIIERKREKL